MLYCGSHAWQKITMKFCLLCIFFSFLASGLYYLTYHDYAVIELLTASRDGATNLFSI
jgi:hypothetical protein